MGRTNHSAQSGECRAIGELLGRIGDKWKVLVVVALYAGPRRFSELKRAVGGISQQMLTSTLKTLERDGMVLRTVRATTPPQVSYDLSDLGRSLAETLRPVAVWSLDHLAAIEASRQRYDTRTRP